MYQPKPLSENLDLAALAKYVQDELHAVSQAARDSLDSVQLNVLYVAPKKPRAGVIVEADGTNWNPGAGAGTYIYRAGAWVKLG